MTIRRRKLLTVLIVLAVMAITLASILHETDMTTQYGMTRIHMPRQTVYVKARACSNAACRGELWLSRNSDRCKAPDPTTDYRAQFDQILYATNGDTLEIVGGPATVTEPTGSQWLRLAFLPRFGPSTNADPLHYIMFGHHLPERNIPVENVDLSACVRAFGHDW